MMFIPPIRSKHLTLTVDINQVKMKSIVRYKYIFFVLSHLFHMNMYGQAEPISIGVVGLTHTHVHWIFNSNSNEEFEIVGIVEPNRELAVRYAQQYDFSMDMVMPYLQGKEIPQAT